MDHRALVVFRTVALEQSFSRAAQKLLRTQPAISLALQRLEEEIGQKLMDRSGKHLKLTDAGKTVLEYSGRFENLEHELMNALAELRDRTAGRLTIGANESTTLYLLRHIARYRSLYPRIKVEVRRSLSSKIPGQLLDGDLDLGVVSYEPAAPDIESTVIYRDALVLVVSPSHRFARKKAISIGDLEMETFIAHNVMSPYRGHVLEAFQKHKVALHDDVEMPTIESIRKLVQAGEGVAFVPRMCVEDEIEQGTIREVRVRELHVERNIRLLHSTRRTLSHAATAFLEVVGDTSARPKGAKA